MPKYREKGPVAATPIEWLTGLLFSLKFGLVLLIILTVVSIIGTLLPPPSEDVSQLEHAQRVVYYTWWFQGLLLLMSLNMLLATWRNVVRTVIPAMGPMVVKSPVFYEKAVPSAQLPPCDAGQVDGAFRQAGFRVRRDGAFATAARGELTRWGAPVAHVGMAIVLLAGFASKWTSSEGWIRLAEGGQTSRMVLSTAEAPREVPLGFNLRVEDFDTAFFPKTRIPSHFISTVTVQEPGREPRTGPVEVNQSMSAGGWKLHQTSYQEMPGGKRYLMTVDGPDLATSATLELSPGQERTVPGVPGLNLALGAAPSFNWVLRQGDKTVQQGTLAGGVKLQVRADQFEPDFFIGADRKAGSRSQELNNPALQVTLMQDGNEIDRVWLFGREDMKAMMHGGQSNFELELTGIEGEPGSRLFHLDIRDRTTGMNLGHLDLALGAIATLDTGEEVPEAAPDGPWSVRLAETVPLYSTTITLTRNAAVPVAYLGCFLIMAGLILAFFIQRREVFMRQEGDGGPIKLVGVYRQNQSEFDPATRAVITRLETQATAARSGRTESSNS